MEFGGTRHRRLIEIPAIGKERRAPSEGNEKMSDFPPPVARKPSGVQVMIIKSKQRPPGGLPSSPRENGSSFGENQLSKEGAEREVEIMNHCFDDVERFMARLQQAAEAQRVLSQRTKKRSKKSNKKEEPSDNSLAMKASPPPEEEFLDIFQKIKYSLCLLARLQPYITQPDAPQLLHPVFVPLDLMVKTTGGPALGASVVSPAMTTGAISLLQEHLTNGEKDLWKSLGPNWTLPCSQLSVAVPPYSPAFLDGWQPRTHDSTGRPREDPIESQHKQDALKQRRTSQNMQMEDRGYRTDGVGTSVLPEGDRLYRCSYDFLARNHTELSVLQGETLEVLESSDRWSKCRNRFEEIGCVPSNILEPLSALNTAESSVVYREKTSNPPRARFFSYAASSPIGTSSPPISPVRPQSMVLSSTLQGEDGDRVLIMNDELLERLSKKRGSSRRTPPRTPDTSAPLNFQSPPAEVQAWLLAKGFSQQTVQCLGILNGAQLFSLNKGELRTVSPEEGARVYSQIMVQKALLQDVHKVTELEKAMERQKLKIDLESEKTDV
ncbi:epidermal growth factor receptor kinase substrate 8-like protein 1a [Takifugu flavidus]|nr:epidermal growth factor receptor kinase substrate 8-like protein 1a [Takifugu flavidus]